MNNNFETELRDLGTVNLGGQTLSAEAAEIERAARQAEEAETSAFLEKRRREMQAEKNVADKEARERSAENLETQAIEIFMTANPSHSWHDAKFLYDTELRKTIAIRRFEAAFFAEKPKADFQM
jgi:hypothetical protein